MRTVTYNVYGCTGWPEDAAAETWGPDASDGVVDRVVAEIGSVSPDVFTLSEAPPEAVVRRLAEGLGMSAHTFPSREDWPGALLTTGRIREAETFADRLGDVPIELFTRHAGRAVVAVDGRELVVYSVHLHPSEEPTRMREVERLGNALAADVRSDRPVVLQGDLNHRPDEPEYEAWRDAGLRDAFAEVGGPEPTIKADDPARRIDYVWVSERLGGRVRAARVLDDPPFGSGPDRSNAGGPFLSDHLPVSVDLDLS